MVHTRCHPMRQISEPPGFDIKNRDLPLLQTQHLLVSHFRVSFLSFNTPVVAMSASTTNNTNMMVLLLVNGFSPSDLSVALSNLKSQTKNLGTHKQRDAFWQAYQQIQGDLNKYSSIDVDGGKLYGLVKYYHKAFDDDDDNYGNDTGRTEFEPFTNRQKALVQTPRLMMGRHIKLMMDDATGEDDNDNNKASGKEFFMPWFGAEAQACYDDITAGEECITLDSDRGLFISTRIKRKHCGNLPSNVLKSLDSLLTYIRELAPDKPLQSIAWTAHQPPRVNSYNVILTGVWPTSITHHLDANVATHTNTTSMHEIYDAFLTRRNNHYIDQAEALIGVMLTQVAKSHGSDNSSSVHVGSMKDLATAKRNALLKKVYLDAGKTKFIQNALADGDASGFEMIVVQSRPPEKAGKFEEYGGVVFETFYKLDLSIYA